MSKADDLRRLGDAEWELGNKEMSARYHEQARRAAEQEKEKAWDSVVRKHLPTFKRHGFYGNGIDFSDVKPEAIAAMANALVELEQSEKEDAAWLSADGQHICSWCQADIPNDAPNLCAACVANGVR
jgi:hypothetical protein